MGTGQVIWEQRGHKKITNIQNREKVQTLFFCLASEIFSMLLPVGNTSLTGTSIDQTASFISGLLNNKLKVVSGLMWWLIIKIKHGNNMKPMWRFIHCVHYPYASQALSHFSVLWVYYSLNSVSCFVSVCVGACVYECVCMSFCVVVCCVVQT